MKAFIAKCVLCRDTHENMAGFAPDSMPFGQCKAVVLWKVQQTYAEAVGIDL